jgi:hypothetical protein
MSMTARSLRDALDALGLLHERVARLEGLLCLDAPGKGFVDQLKDAQSFSKHKGMPAGCLPDEVRDAVISRFADEQVIEEKCVYDGSRRVTINLRMDIPGTHFHFIIEQGTKKNYCLVVALYKEGPGKPPSKRVTEHCKSFDQLCEFIAGAGARVVYWETQVEPVLVEMGLVKVNGGEYSLQLDHGVLLTACPSLFPDCVCMLFRNRKLPDMVIEDLSQLRGNIDMVKRHPQMA